MALKTVLDNFAKAKADYEQSSKTIGLEAQKEIASAISAVLPDGYVFVWTQATPYFNDGDPCVFMVHEGYACTQEQYANGDHDEGHEMYGAKNGQFADLNAVWSRLRIDANRALMLAAFGDHAKIVINKDGTYERISYEDHD